MDALVRRLIQFYQATPLPPIPEKAGNRPFTPKNRQSLLEMLDARIPGRELDFYFAECLRAVDILELHARKYKNAGDQKSLREIVRLLVAASGHDLHGVRNRSSLLLERILAPRSLTLPSQPDSQLTRVNETYRFSFNLPVVKSGYILQIFGECSSTQFMVDQELDYVDVPMQRNGSEYTAEYHFRSIGKYDWSIGFKRGNNLSFLKEPAGRISIIPDVRGHVFLEIFQNVIILKYH